MAEYSVEISHMRTRITLQRPTVATDAGGAQSPSWENAPVAPIVWSRWVNAHGQEAVQSDALKSVQRATVAIRYRADVDASWRVLKDGQAWQIVSDPDDVQHMHKWLEMIVERAKGTVTA